jgi:hypothetical protein
MSAMGKPEEERWHCSLGKKVGTWGDMTPEESYITPVWVI